MKFMYNIQVRSTCTVVFLLLLRKSPVAYVTFWVVAAERLLFLFQFQSHSGISTLTNLKKLQFLAQWERMLKRGLLAKVKHNLLFWNPLVFSTIFYLSPAIFSFYSLIPLCHRLYPAENLQAAKKSGDLPEIWAGYRKPHSLLFRSRLARNWNKTGSHIFTPKTTGWLTCIRWTEQIFTIYFL